MVKESIRKILFLICITLLVISCLGDFTNLGSYSNNEKRKWERFDEALVSRTNTVDELILEAKKRNFLFHQSEEIKMIALYEVVIDRFTHNGGAKHSFFTNWILYSLGNIHPALGTMMDPELFVGKGHSLICSQISFLLMQMALKEGVIARHVGLNGHVVMEAWYDNDWHLFDPDLEIIPRSDDGLILSVDKISQDDLLLKREYPISKGDYHNIILTRFDNSFISYPKGAYFEWKSQLLFYIEKAAELLKYIIPIILIVTLRLTKKQ